LRLWKFLHIASMFGAVSIVVGGGLIRNAILRGGQLASIRRVLATQRRLENLAAGPLFAAGVVFGVITALTTGFSLLAPWLLTAYALVIAIFVHAFVFSDPHIKKVEEAAASSDEGPSPQLQALIRSPRIRVHSGVDMFLFAAIIFAMVVKPFS
jgi:uncharacterized membrane protein